MESGQTHKNLLFIDGLVDHRVERRKLHSMPSIVFITVAAVISGCETWNEVELFGQTQADWVERYVELPNGIPSHDTFNRFFSSMDPQPFEQCFRKWVASFAGELDDTVVNVDGKSVRGCKTSPTSALHIVSAWSAAAGITLGQVKTPDKQSELVAVMELLDTLFLEGSIVTLDALSTHPHIVSKIREREAHYMIQVKRNRMLLFKDIENAFVHHTPDRHTTEQSVHGRTEIRRISVLPVDKLVMTGDTHWEDLSAIIRVTRWVKENNSGEEHNHTAYYISSVPELNAKRAAEIIRAHWAIENNLHWMLDVAFNEDADRKQNHNAVVNFSLIRKISMAGLSKVSYKNIGMKSKRKAAMMDVNYREQVINQL